MKRSIGILASSLLLGLILFSCTPDTTVVIPDGGPYTPSDAAREYFLADATEFAVAELVQTKSPDTSLVIPPAPAVDKYLLPLARLYDARQDFPLLDTLLAQKHIRKYVNSSISLDIKADTTYAWVQNALHEVFPTGNATVDSLVRKYNLGFDVGVAESFHLNPVWFATFPNPMNVLALGRAFSAVPGVLQTAPNSYISFFTNLKVAPGPSATTIQLYYGYGDCFAGCFGYDCWTFSVDRNYAVTYLGHTRT